MPRHASKMPICAPEKAACVEGAVIETQENAFANDQKSHLNCNCLPGCTEIEYPHETSASSLKRASLVHKDHEIESK